MDRISTCGWGEDMETSPGQPSKGAEQGRAILNTNGSTLAKLKDAWWETSQKRPEHQGWTCLMMMRKEMDGPRLRAMALSKVNIDQYLSLLSELTEGEVSMTVYS